MGGKVLVPPALYTQELVLGQAKLTELEDTGRGFNSSTQPLTSHRPAMTLASHPFKHSAASADGVLCVQPCGDYTDF